MRQLVLLFLSFVFLSCGESPEQVNSIGQSTRIVGGKTVQSGDPISKVIVGIYGTSKCTATIVSKDLLMTARHCIKGRKMTAVFGRDPRFRSERRRITVMEVHPNADIALVKFEGGLPSGYKASKVLDDARALYNGRTVTLAGYGVTGTGRKGRRSPSILRRVDTRIHNASFHGNKLVMLDQRGGRGACYGDSGGPSFVKVDGEYHVFGVTSRGYDDPSDTCKRFSLYVNVNNYWSWIKKTVLKISKHGKFGQLDFRTKTKRPTKPTPRRVKPVNPRIQRPIKRSVIEHTADEPIVVRELIWSGGQQFLVEVAELPIGSVIRFDEKQLTGRLRYEDQFTGRIRRSNYGWFKNVKVISAGQYILNRLKGRVLYVSETAL